MSQVGGPLGRIIWIACGGWLWMACSSHSVTEGTNGRCEEPVYVAQYGVVPLQKQLVYEEFILPGEIVALPSQTVPLVSLVDGVVEEVSVHLGEVVEAGQPLLVLRSPQLMGWQARQQMLPSLLQAARLKAATLDSLFLGGLASRSEVAQARADLAALIAESLEVASNLHFYRQQEGRFVLPAPRAGTLIQLAVRKGMPIRAGDTLLTISNISMVRAQIYFYADQAEFIRPGLPVRIKITGSQQAPIQTTFSRSLSGTGPGRTYRHRLCRFA